MPPSINLANINIASGLSSKNTKTNTILESFKLNEFPEDKYMDLNEKLSTVY